MADAALNILVGFLDEQAELIKQQSIRLKEYLNKNDKNIANAEKSESVTESHTKKSKKPIDPNKPKPPPTEYQIFMSNELIKLRESHPELAPKERNELARKIWNERKKTHTTESGNKDSTELADNHEAHDSNGNTIKEDIHVDEHQPDYSQLTDDKSDIVSVNVFHNPSENDFEDLNESDSAEKKKKKKKHKHSDDSEVKKKKKKKDKEEQSKD
mmetsp:Transcript_4626/g.4142  ORF Transcript_4626/g.4142 Transcript_4626/m.4142 type:complete len:214 (-) Transcript_4626:161-802(-)|eukprot:CAMPEP_0196762262 /NCGR_PEP_ID=MMETSP1095-20130614/1672_1 /TAXON_ID=96789 ORGANISM="Chromulina nebulosa, Strain UTEXLB2642" /NCGR_SAMPLE_ID=MMETSP1095 /ASSEMBLY_ACC=CAM_ASM_000446 /LENGTH=213 /DNA_ID=CAMNT_0042112839 /DNA_START=34 /DNA_END=675 /DNA_ORIENTATION=+